MTPYLSLRDLRTGATRVYAATPIRIGRDPGCDVVAAGDEASVVSSCHAILAFDQGRWTVTDAGSRNGTYLGDRRLDAAEAAPLVAGATIGLGTTGPRFRVEATEERRVAPTVDEMPRYDPALDATVPMAALPDAPAPPPAPRAAAVEIVMKETQGGERHRAAGGRIRLGRGDECELRPLGLAESVSRVHAEIVLRPDGAVVVRDARSRNGTLVNGRLITVDHPLKKGDRIQLGEAGPELVVEHLAVPGPRTRRAAGPGDRGPKPRPAPGGPVRRSFGGKGATVFFKEVVETSRRSTARLRWVVWSFVILMVLAVATLYWYGEVRVQETVAALDAQRRDLDRQREVADSVRAAAQADYDRLRVELEAARGSSAPAAVVDSLRDALAAASRRTGALEAALARAETTLVQQLAAGDSLRGQAQTELARLRADLTRASGAAVSAGLIDSLRGAVRDAERRAAGIEAQVRAVRGANLASVAQVNQGAVGLVSAFVGPEVFDGSGFTITPSGYFVTNRHVAQPGGKTPDSLYVTMADQQYMSRAELVGAAPPGGPDLALLKIRSYRGPQVGRVDWTGANARQGEPAALIGFPAGIAAALDQTRTVRTSMSAGIFSKITPEVVQFDGFTVGGSSGSPVFNASGEVVAVHRSGLKEAAGLGFAVPMALLIPLLPADARAELGIR